MTNRSFGCVLMCDAAASVPHVGDDQTINTDSTTNGMRQAASHLVAQKPTVVLIVSPHTGRHHEAFGIVSGSRLAGHFGEFGHTDVKIEMENNRQVADELQNVAVREQLPLVALPALHLDRGALVPLWFLREAGYSGSIILCSLPLAPQRGFNRRFGDVVAKTAASSSQNLGLVVVGAWGSVASDNHMTEHIADALRQSDLRRALDVDRSTGPSTHFSLMDSLEIGAAAISFRADGVRLLSSAAIDGRWHCVLILQ